MTEDWDKRYRDQDTPWDHGHPSGELERVFSEYRIDRGSALELGCGTGWNCVYLASIGFDVTGIDISPTAIDAARNRAAEADTDCRFMLADIYNPPAFGKLFDFIFDRGCFHSIRQIDEPAFVAITKRLLAPDGWFLVLTGNAKEPLEHGPPVVSEDKLHNAFADHFEIVHLREFRFDVDRETGASPLAWSVLMRHS